MAPLPFMASRGVGYPGPQLPHLVAAETVGMGLDHTLEGEASSPPAAAHTLPWPRQTCCPRSCPTAAPLSHSNRPLGTSKP